MRGCSGPPAGLPKPVAAWTRTITQVIGANMRRIRESRAKVLHDVSTAARDLGLTWDASAVSRIETGKRGLDLEEFVALPIVMTLALNEPVTMADLLDLDADEATNLKNFDRRIGVVHVFPLLAEPWFIVFGGHDMELEGEALSQVVRKSLDAEKVRAQVAREPDEERGIYRELQAVADELGVKVGELIKACKVLWGEYTISPTDEREKRLLNSGADLSNPTSVRTLRGHITRQLMTELRDYFGGRQRDEEPSNG
jgi:hypothetical protein